MCKQLRSSSSGTHRLPAVATEGLHLAAGSFFYHTMPPEFASTVRSRWQALTPYGAIACIILLQSNNISDVEAVAGFSMSHFVKIPGKLRVMAIQIG